MRGEVGGITMINFQLIEIEKISISACIYLPI